MDFILQRSRYGADGVFGVLTDKDSDYTAITLEHAFEGQPGVFKPIIPAGDYTCQRYFSPKHGYDVFLVCDVPGHTYVEIHIGDFNKDSDGCVLLGQGTSIDTDGARMLTKSTLAFRQFMELQQDINEFELTVIDQLPKGIGGV
jgi:hypothetical protein